MTEIITDKFTVIPDVVKPPDDTWTPTPPGSQNGSIEFDSCDDETPVADTDPVVVLEPLPFVLELPASKKTSIAASDISSDIVSNVETTAPSSPPPKFEYSVQSCTDEDIPVFEDLANRTVGTVGFIGGLMVYLGCLCCLFNKNAKQEIAETYNKHTLFSYLWPRKYIAGTTK